jgi:ankyrin repeat protein
LAVEANHLAVVKVLLNYSNFDSTHNVFEAVQFACKNGNLPILQCLLSHFAIRREVGYKDRKPTDYYMGMYDPSFARISVNTSLLGIAAQNGHHLIVKCLLDNQFGNPAACDNYLIQLIAQKGHKKVLEVLIADKRIHKQGMNKIIQGLKTPEERKLLNEIFTDNFMKFRLFTAGKLEKNSEVSSLPEELINNVIASHFLQ